MAQLQTAPANLLYVPPRVQFLEVERSFSAQEFAAQIRRYRWNFMLEGSMTPAHHFLDVSLTGQPRTGRLMVGARTELRVPGKILFMPAGYASTGKSGMGEHRSLAIAFSERFVRDTLGDQDVCFSPCFDIRDPVLQSFLASLVDELLAPGFASEVYVQSTVAALVVQLARLHHKNLFQFTRSGHMRRDPRRVSRARELIQANLHREIDIGSIACGTGTSPRHLARVFKATTGMTLGEYIAETRISRAKALLHDSDLRIQEISLQCGFRNAEYFATAFKRLTGESPSQYRRATVRSLERHDPR